ncbi:MAG: AzlC family ABC transporter permease [Rhodopila sp.]
MSFGVAIYGLAFGLLAAQAKMNELLTGAMSTLVFAGSSQIVATQRLVSGAGAAASVLAGLALNLRILLMTASLRDELRARPPWQVLLGVHLTSDENWALLHAARAKGRRVGYWYLVGGGTSLLLVWVMATVIGVDFATVLPSPAATGMDFAFTAAFIAILRNLWRGRGDFWPWLLSAGGAAALALLAPIDPSWALACGGVAGAFLAGARRDA